MDLKESFSAQFEAIDDRISQLESAQSGESSVLLAEIVEQALVIAGDLLRVFSAAEGKQLAESTDILALFKEFVKGDPSLTAIRDNLRELVYYQNCLQMQREDALPPKPESMAIRSLRHVYLYLATRAEQAGWLN